MGTLEIIIMAILVIFGAIGYKRGVISVAASVVAMIVTFLVCIFVSPLVADYVKENTDVYNDMNKSIYNIILENKKFNNAIESVVPDTSTINLSNVDSKSSEIALYVKEVTEKLHLPSFMSEYKTQDSMSERLNKVVDDNVIEVKNAVAGAMASKLAGIAFNAIVYIAVYLVIFILMKIFLSITNIIANLPIIKQANRIMGLALGLIEGVMIIWLVFAVITACSNFEWASNLIMEIGNNAFLSFLYEHNLIISTITKGI